MWERSSGIILIILVILTKMLTSSCSMNKPSEDDLLLYARASSVYQEARYAEAAELLSKIEGFSPALTLKGKALFFSGDDGAAEKCLRRALRLYPNGAEAGIYLARLLREKGETEEALKLTENMLSGDPQNVRALRLASELAKDRGPSGEASASAFLDRAIEASVETSLVFLDRAKLRWTNGNRQGAMEDLKKARELLPYDSPLMRSIKTIESAISNATGENAS
ncbi:tetratricopeptide repeat protein [Leadbettera azotonutricia]|uniref:Tetratricopeptide repeat domain protein n=1 Tax=Leadbettera azotonutricia (strain ATCC BAA-888 / DSM 13862 / ZAS-9) TaxID=545695 RepID=F5Y6M8_LEAAZ|nr:tetratricopeptide repeat protein [Leadbettera azotonutricia]AEF81839.1 tetratricopeptide repeat domain protein [Leadbettera azotonutricia ZAS-9]